MSNEELIVIRLTIIMPAQSLSSFGVSRYMFFNKESEKSSNEISVSTTDAPGSSLKRTTKSSDLQTLLECFNTKMSLTIGDNDEDIKVELVEDDEEPESSFSLAPIPPTHHEPYIASPIPIQATKSYKPNIPTKPRTYENVAAFIGKMEGLFRQVIEMSQHQSNPLSDFLHLEENIAYLSQWKILSAGMRKFLFNGGSQEYDSFLYAFDHFKASKGFSISCYLTLHNPHLGNYLLENASIFNEINDAFHRYLSNPKKRSANSKTN
jgi:hypothetical protein